MARSVTPMGVLAERIQQRLDVLGISEREASRRAGFSLSYVNEIMKGRSKSPEGARLVKLAEVLECDLEFLLGTNDSPRTPAKLGANGTGSPVVRLIPLYSARQEGGVGQLIEQPIDRLPALPSLANVPNAYAFAIFSNTMEPRYFVGEIVFVHPAIPPRAGDFVLCRLKDKTVGVARLDSIDLHEARFSLLNVTPEHFALFKSLGYAVDGNQIVQPLDNIEAIHRIVGSAG